MVFVSGTAAPGVFWVTLERVAVVAGAKARGIANIATNTTTEKATLLVIALTPFKVGLSDGTTTNCPSRCAVL
jgi:hypothetical protein